MTAYEGPSIDHSLLSPSGRISKRARKAAIERDEARVRAWFMRKYPEQTAEQIAATKSAARAVSLRRTAANLLDLASRGMKPRAYPKAAARMIAEAEALEGGGA